MKNTVILSAARTPIASFQGAFAEVPTPDLGAAAIKAAVERAGIPANQIEEVIMGCVLPAGLGQSPARQASLKAGLPVETGVLTINKVCGSGLKAVMLADQMIRSGDCSAIVAGGMENMSRAPYLLQKARTGYRMGHGELLDSMILDGLWDPYNNFHMGAAAEMCVREFKMSREAQDQYATMSYERALSSIKDGRFKDEIAPVAVPQRKGDPLIVDTDEEPSRGNTAKLPSLRPAFDKAGSVTAGNASTLNDGAAALVVTSAEYAQKNGKIPLATIVAHATASQAPEWFTTAPVVAIQKALDKAGLTIEDIDLFEINEAFSCVAMAAVDHFKLSLDKVNVNGGAVAMGHPIGASGARILTTLIYEMKRRNVKRGLATLCIGGGEAVAMIVER
ncbi:MAG: acetyl-CoA C-acyltransferase [Deltaproteobacteria bacterium CG11_big_fil_rev_8_21_14_0_20_47_16]|nr:MAG: acetyl-CoA C-acyltransferase [Deltaproteobacteria bacterium CG11_big_fil_rev_8_21_14_0_20_47_16]